MFSSMVMHGAVFDDFSVSTRVSIPKSKTAGHLTIVLYITLSSIFSKRFDRIILNQYADLIDIPIYSLVLKRNAQPLCVYLTIIT